MAIFAFCLTQTAFVSVGTSGLSEVTIESANTRSIDILTRGWIALPLFVLYQLVPSLVAFAFSYLILARRERPDRQDLILCTFAVVVIIAIVMQLFFGKKIVPFGLGAWLANPGIVIAWLLYLFASRRSAFVAAAITFVMMLSFLSVDGVPFGTKDAVVPIQKYGAGYWAWIVSAVIMVAASFPYGFRSIRSAASRDI